MKRSRIHQTLQVLLSALVIIIQFASPAIALAETLIDERQSAKERALAAANAPPGLPSPEELEATLGELLNVSPADSDLAAYERALALAVDDYVALREAQREAQRKAWASPLPTAAEVNPRFRPISAEALDAAFVQLLETYLGLPKDLDPAERARYELAFTLAIEAYSAHWDTLVAAGLAPAAPPVEVAPEPATAEQPLDEDFMRALEDYINDPDSVDESNPFFGMDEATAAEGEDNLWSLDSYDAATGQQANWVVSADPESLAAFDETFTEVMAGAPATADAQPTAASEPAALSPLWSNPEPCYVLPAAVDAQPAEHNNPAASADPVAAPPSGPAASENPIPANTWDQAPSSPTEPAMPEAPVPMPMAKHTVDGGGGGSVYAADVDGDSDLDVLIADSNDDEISWWKNDGTPKDGGWTKSNVTESFGRATSAYAAKVDVGSDLDVIGGSLDDGILWWENDGSGGWITHTVDAGFTWVQSVYAADLDGDNDLDVIGASYDYGIAWWENDGSGGGWTKTSVATGNADSVYAVDIDGVNGVDILGSVGDAIIWWKNNGSGGGWVAEDVDVSVNRAEGVHAGDMNGDGDMDVLGTTYDDDAIIWWESSGPGSWTKHTVGTATAATSVHAVDMDADGDLDVLGAPYGGADGEKLFWWENTGPCNGTGGACTDWTKNTLNWTGAWNIASVYAGDVDNDSDMDILASAHFGGITWWENEAIADNDGQFLLETTDTAPTTLKNGETDDFFRIKMTHNGNPGDTDEELATLRLLLENPSGGAALNTADANAIIENLYVYLDDGDNAFDVGDTLVATVTNLSLVSGHQTVTFTDGDPNVQVVQGTPKTFFVVVELTADAYDQDTPSLRITHITTGTTTSTAEDRDHDLDLILRKTVNVSSGTIYLTYWDRVIGATGLNGTVHALVKSGSDVYAGGAFTGKVAKWNGSAWTTLGGGRDNTVYALAMSGSDVIAGGAFTGKVAKWNGSAWTTMGSLDGDVYAIAISGSDIYAGGAFTGKIAKWNSGTSSWDTLGGGANGTVRAIALDGSDVYIGGNFGSPATNVAKWNGSSWESLDSGLAGGFDNVLALAMSGGDLYAGGDFLSPVDAVARGLARWDGSAWYDVAGGVSGGTKTVRAFAANGSDLYVGGNFTGTASIASANVLRWNGAYWAGLESGTAGTVHGLAPGSLYAGGDFDTAAGVASKKVAHWNPPTVTLTLKKTASPVQVPPGGTVTYTLNVTNTGALTATGVALRDTLPEDFVYSSGSAGCSGSGRVVTCTLSNMANGVSTTVQIVATAPITTGVYTNTAVVGAQQPESDGTDNFDRFPVEVVLQADLSLDKTAPSSVAAGEQLTYTLTVTNSGPEDAPNITLTDNLPTGVAFQSASTGCSHNGGTPGAVTCNLGSLTNGANKTIKIGVKVNPALAGGTNLVNNASVTSGASDPTPGNNSDPAATGVTVDADLSASKNAPALVCIHGDFLYNLNVTNHGPSQATGVTLNDTLSSNVDFQSASGGCNHSGGAVTCNVGALAPGASEAYTISVEPKSGLADYTVLHNSVSVSASTPDSNGGNDSDTADTTVRTDCTDLQADLELGKSAPSTVGAGGVLTFTLVVTNHGALGATGVTISDTLPGGVTFQAGASSGSCSESGGVVTCDVDALSPGAKQTVYVVVSVPIGMAPGTVLDNTASVSVNEDDFETGNNSDSSSSTVIIETDLALDKTATAAVNAGETIAYTLTVTNDGPSNSTGVTLTDTLPDGVIYNASSSSHGTCSESNRVVTCDLNPLNASASAIVYITVTPFNAGTFTNTATATTADTDPNGANDTAETSTNVGAPVRETKYAGNIRVTANAFIDLGGGQEWALGNVTLGAQGGAVDHYYVLSGANDSVTLTASSLTGNGAVTLIDGNLALFSGDFDANGTLAEPLLIPDAGVTYDLGQVAGFDIQAGLALTPNLKTGETDGQATLRVNPPGVDKSVGADFKIMPGPAFDGTVETFALTLAGSTLAVTGAALTNDGISLASVTLTLAGQFGGGSCSVTDLLITRNSFSIGGVGGTFPLPDVNFGSGDKLKITNGQASLSYVAGIYVMMGSGTLSLNLPSNVQEIAIVFRFDSAGNISASLSQLSLSVAGGTLAMKDIALGNNGLSVAVATLTLASSMRGVKHTVENVTITGDDGLSIGGVGVTIPLPDIYVGDGSKVAFTNLAATLTVSDLGGGEYAYTFAVNGTLNLRLPQNSQDVNFQAQIDSNGNFSGSLDQLTLNITKAQLVLENITFNNSGLSVETGTLSISLGGSGSAAQGTVTDLTIDKNGLSVGSGGITVPIPAGISLGSGSSGLSLTNVTVTIELAADRTFKITIAGSLLVKIPSAEASATASISVDSRGKIRGSVESFTLQVAGLGLAVEGAQITGNTLSIEKAALQVPPAWGGLTAEVYNLRIGPDGLSIGGGAFSLPDIRVGKITLAGLYGSFKSVGGGYEISAGGTFVIPGMGGGAGCGIKVGLTLFAEGGQTVMRIHTIHSAEEWARARGMASMTGLGPEEVQGLALRRVECGLVGCRIPIGQTGFFLTRVEGSLTLSQGTTRIELGVSVESAFSVGGVSAVRGDADLGVQFNPFQLDFEGAITLFSIFKAAELSAVVRSGFFKADLVVRQLWPPLEGGVGLTVWTTDGSFHLVGYGYLQIGFKKGAFGEACLPFFGWPCVKVPPFDFVLAKIRADFGEFRKGSGTTWGLKCKITFTIPIIDVDVGFGVYFDVDGDWDVGNVDKYKTVTPPSVARARALWDRVERYRAPGVILSEEERDLLNGIRFPQQSVTLIDVDIAASADVLFLLSREGDAPTMTLITPDDVEVTPGSLPANIGYSEDEITGTVEGEVRTATQFMYGVIGAQPGAWQIKLTGDPVGDDQYIVQVFGIDPEPTLENLSAVATGSSSAEFGWSLTSNEITTTLNIYATPGPITATFTVTNSEGHLETISDTIFTGFPIATDVDTPLDGAPASLNMDLSNLESGVYWIWFDANDWRNPPIRAYAPNSLTVVHNWQNTWTSNVQATESYRQLLVEWDRHPNPDVDGYRLYVATEPGVVPPSAGVISYTVGDVLSYTLYSLTPDQTYYLSVAAVNEDVEPAALSFSEEIVATTPEGASFELTAASTEFTLIGGTQASTVMTITTGQDAPIVTIGVSVTTELSGSLVITYVTPITMAVAPVVGLIEGNNPDGITLILDTDMVTPTQGGAAVGLVISTTETLYGGDYSASIVGSGGGEDRALQFDITIQEPTFALNPAPAAITIDEDGENVSVNVSAASFFGESDPVHLSIGGIPVGLLYDWSSRVVNAGGGNVTLTCTDTVLLENGTYTLTLSGEDGENTKTADVVLTVEKPGFTLTTEQSHKLALHGETVTFTLDLAAFEWPHQIRLELDAFSDVPGSTLGFVENPGDTPADTINVTAPAQVYLATAVTSDTTPGLYMLNVVGTSQGEQETLGLELMVYAEAVNTDVSVDQPSLINALAGTNYVYTITVTNHGPLTATNVVVSDTLPVSVTYGLATPSQGSCSESSGVVTCDLDDILRDGQATVRVEGTVDQAAPEYSLLTNVARARTDETEVALLNNEKSGTLVVEAQADLSVTITDDPDAVDPGGALKYVLTVANGGPSAATHVELENKLPSDASFQSATSDRGACSHSQGVVTCDLKSINTNGSAQVTITTTVDARAGGTLENEATVSSDKEDPNPGDNTDTEETTVNENADLSVSKVAFPTPAIAGQDLTYVITVTNDGPAYAESVVISDVLPSGVSYKSDNSGGQYDKTSGAWEVGDLGNGASETLHIWVTVDKGAVGDTIANTAIISRSSQPDPFSGNDQNDAATLVIGADLKVDKTVSADRPNEEDTIVYAVTVTNDGPANATNVVVSDTLPGGVSYFSDDDGGGNYNSTTGRWNIDSLVSTASATLRITATVDAGTAGDTITNSAVIIGADQGDLVSSNDEDDAVLTVLNAELAIDKDVSEDIPSPEWIIVYTVTLTNNGPDNATGVVVSDTLPVSMTWKSHDTTQGSYDRISGIWNVGSLNDDISATLYITAEVGWAPDNTLITNTAVISASDQSDRDPSNNRDDRLVAVNGAELEVVKTVDDSEPNEGNTITYTVAVTNNRSYTTTNVTVSDTLPSGVTYGGPCAAARREGKDGGSRWGAEQERKKATLHFTATVNVGAAGQAITNTAAISTSSRADPIPENNQDGAGIVPQGADLVITKTVNNDTPNEGTIITYTITVTNTGPADTKDVVVSDTLPSGVAYDSHSGNGTFDKTTGRWNIAGALDNGDSATLYIAAEVGAFTAGGVITNTAIVTETEKTDLFQENNVDSASIEPRGADLEVKKTVDNDTPNEGIIITYTLTVTNTGPADAIDIVVSDTLPSGVTYDSHSGGTYHSNTGAWKVSDLDNGDHATLYIAAEVDAFTAGSVITNTAAISETGRSDLYPDNNADSTSIEPRGADLAMAKTVNTHTPNEDSIITYTLILTNTGPADAIDIVISDTLPVSVTYQSQSGDGTYNAVTGTWSVDILNYGDSATLHIAVEVITGTERLLITNTAAISETGRSDLNPENDEDDTIIAVQDADAVGAGITPEQGGVLVYTDTQGLVTIVKVPAGAVTDAVTLVYTPLPEPTQPITPPFRFAGHAFSLEIYEYWTLLPGYVFKKPVTITIHYSDEDVAGLQEDKLILEYWNGEAWEDAVCGDYEYQYHPDENWMSVPICHLSLFALFAPPLPIGGVTMPVSLLTLLWTRVALLIVAIGVMIGVGAAFGRRRR